MKFEKAPDEKIEHYWGEVCILIEEMGFKPEEVMVTDESWIADFYDGEDDEELQNLKQVLEWRYNVIVKYKDPIWKVAERMKYAE